jgi:O-antigen/teichoic acid export membrane protein
MPSSMKNAGPNSPKLEGKFTALLGKRLSPYITSTISLFSGKGAREGYLAAIDQGIISISNFLATLVLARNISPTELGVYGVGFTGLRLVRAVQEGIIIQPLNAFGAALNHEEFKRYLTNTGIIQLILACGSAGGIAIVGWILTRLGNDTAGPGVFALWPAFLFLQLQEFIRRSLYTRDRVIDAVINTGLTNFCRISLIGWLIYQSNLSGVTGLLAIAFGSAVGWTFGLWQTRSYWDISSFNLRGTWKQNWAFGRWILGGTITNNLATEFYPVLTAGLVDFAAAGAYRALQILVAPIHVLLRATDTFLTPKGSKIFQKEGVRALSRAVRLTYIVIGIPISILLVIVLLFPEQLLNLLYGDTYLSYSRGIVLMSLFYVFLYIYSPAQTALKAVRVSRPIFLANILAILAMATLGVWMTIQWGVYGTIAGQVVNGLIISFVLWSAWLVVKRNLE